MKINRKITLLKVLPLILAILFTSLLSAQENGKKIQFGGGIGASFGSNYTDVSLSPSAIYNFNQYLAAGVGLQGSYVRVKNNYKSYLYGGSIIGLVNPIEQIQFSVELEQVRVNSEFEILGEDSIKRNFWNTALFLGLGYRTQNVTIGARYNVLHDKNKTVYYEALMPFVRVYF